MRMATAAGCVVAILLAAMLVAMAIIDKRGGE